MANIKNNAADKDKVVDLVVSGMSIHAAAKEVGVPYSTAYRHIVALTQTGELMEDDNCEYHRHPVYNQNQAPVEEEAEVKVPFLSAQQRVTLERKLREQESTIKLLKEELEGTVNGCNVLNELQEHVKGSIRPKWLTTERSKKKAGSPGIPTVFASDWHYGEVVNPAEIQGINEYDMSVARQRAMNLVNRSIDLLTRHMVNPQYEGIVFVLGGDMVSGDIHEELTETNEMPIMEVFCELYEVLSWAINEFANEFGQVYVPCVTGNHGRTTKKMRAKSRVDLNWDGLLYKMLKKRFMTDSRVYIDVAGGSDLIYSVYGHKYLLTHGDQFRGGDGMIGALGPIMRGDHKKRSRNGDVGLGYDTMIMGHWHQYISMPGRIIVNGSLKGYDEYAASANFRAEKPQQALWITHPKHGITIQMPVNVDLATGEEEKPQNGSWVSVFDYKA